MRHDIYYAINYMNEEMKTEYQAAGSGVQEGRSQSLLKKLEDLPG